MKVFQCMNEDILFTTAKKYGVKELIPVILLHTLLMNEQVREKELKILGENSVMGLLLNDLGYHPSEMDDIRLPPTKITVFIHLWVFVGNPTIFFNPDPTKQITGKLVLSMVGKRYLTYPP